MRIFICHKLKDPLILPINYHQILQGIIYRQMRESNGYSDFVHNQGYEINDRVYRMFTFSLLHGKYKIMDKMICFYEKISFQISSSDVYLLHVLANAFITNGITYADQHYDDVEVSVADATVESNEITIRMLSPICVYKTDPITQQTMYYDPWSAEFQRSVNDNLARKYQAYYGVPVQSEIVIEPYKVSRRDKYVTRYKEFIINAWNGIYILKGERKYLDFLLQTGIGSKNAQGFGMFEEKYEMRMKR